MAKEQEQRQALNKVELVGVVKEQKLNEGKGEKGNYIGGSLVIKTGEFSEIEVSLYVGEMNSKGKPKKTYATLKKFIDGEYLTLASCKNDEDRENVTKVKIFGNKEFVAGFKEDMYKPENSEEVKTRNKIELGFGTITVDNTIKEEDYKATFDIEMYVKTVEEETKDEELTGRVIVNGWMPVYGGKVIPMAVVAGTILDDDGAEYDFGNDILTQVEEGSTINVWGNINYQAKITKTTKGGSIGKAKVEEHKEYINELVIEGADIVPEEKEFDGELIKKAKIERDNAIEEKKNEEPKDNKKSKSKGLSKNEDGTTKAKRPRPNF